jgi:hypothetical protein
MRKFLLLTLSAALTANLLAAPLAQARHALAGSTLVVAAATEPTAPATTVIRGKVVSPAGILPGAVIKLQSTQQIAVANAEGEFQLAVLSDGGPQLATVSVAGFEDEEIVLNPSEVGTDVPLAKAH